LHEGGWIAYDEKYRNILLAVLEPAQQRDVGADPCGIAQGDC